MELAMKCWIATKCSGRGGSLQTAASESQKSQQFQVI